MGYVKKQLSIRKSEICDANSSGLVRVVVRFFFFLLIFINVDREATAQDHIPVDVGSEDTAFTDLNSSGYWFIAPECFIISGFRVPTTAGVLPVSIQVLTFDTKPPQSPAFTNDFDDLEYLLLVDDTNVIDVNFVVSAGDTIGVLGGRGTGESNNIYHAGAYSTTIAGSPIMLRRIAFPGNVNNISAFDVSADTTDDEHIPIIEMFYDTAITASFDTTVFNDSVVFMNTSPLGTVFLWDFGDGNTSTEMDPIHVYAMNGNYTITLTISNECFSDVTTSSILIDGIDDQEWRKPKVSIYPNVTIGPFSVEVYTRESEHISVGIYGLDGQTVSEEAFRKPAGLENRVFDLSSQAKGVYFFKVTHDHGVIVRKVVRL